MKKSPNFLIIMSDQHAPDVIGALGHPCIQTPVLDARAASGVAFTNAYCAYPMCTPSRASFMTGQLTPAHRVWEPGSTLASDRSTWGACAAQSRLHRFHQRTHAHGAARTLESVFRTGFRSGSLRSRKRPHEWHDLGEQEKYAEVLRGLYGEATRDGWDGAALQREILNMQRQLRYISRAETA